MAEQHGLEGAYLTGTDDLLRSGYGGGDERWESERSPLTLGIDRDGDFLDVGCANGRLAEDVVTWASDRGHRLVPHGIDLGARLIDLARARFEGLEDNFVVADAWTWEPNRQWQFVYALLDQSPEQMWGAWIRRLSGLVGPGGRLIIGDYGSRGRSIKPKDVGAVMRNCGFEPIGESAGGNPIVTRFAWLACP